MGVLPNFIAHRPHVAEHDFTGIVVDANETGLTNGQAVYGFIPVRTCLLGFHLLKFIIKILVTYLALTFKTHQGALAEYIRLPAFHVVPRPSTLTPIQAAGLTLAGLTAYRALFRLAKLEQGQSIFINGGSTAVGIYATQLAKALGCTVTASASAKKEPFVRSLGVDHVSAKIGSWKIKHAEVFHAQFIDYTEAPIHEQLERNPPTPKFHVIFETVGGTDVPLYTHCEKYLAPGGVFVSVGVMPYDGLGSIAQACRYALELYRPRFLGGTNRSWK